MLNDNKMMINNYLLVLKKFFGVKMMIKILASFYHFYFLALLIYIQKLLNVINYKKYLILY